MADTLGGVEMMGQERRRNDRPPGWLRRLLLIALWLGLAPPVEGEATIARGQPPVSDGLPVALGMFIPGAPGDPTRLDEFAAALGRIPAIVPWYQAWAGSLDGPGAELDPAWLRSVSERGATPMITWEPWLPSGGLDQPAYRLAAIARGDHDAYVDRWAAGLAAFGGLVYFRFAHEMNATWYPWAVGVNGTTAADYVAAWRHLHQRFALAEADNVRWVWSPDALAADAPSLAPLYPGDDVVDWVAVDGYNWGTSQSWSTWRDFSAVFGPSYQALRALTDKPVMIAEMASSAQGGDKAAWINDAFWWALPVAFPEIRAVVWFNEPTTADWMLDRPSPAWDAFVAAANAPYLQGRLW